MNKNSSFIIIFIVLTSIVLLYACNKKNENDIKTFQNFYSCVKESISDGKTIDKSEKICSNIYYSQEEPPNYSPY